MALSKAEKVAFRVAATESIGIIAGLFCLPTNDFLRCIVMPIVSFNMIGGLTLLYKTIYHIDKTNRISDQLLGER